MAQSSEARVGVYIDFENVGLPASGGSSVADIMKIAASLGSVSVKRAYGDWTANGKTHHADLVSQSFDLVQLFPAAGTKNGADIRLAVDVIDDLYRFDHLTHVVIVAGDSDYVPVAQRVRQLGRRVIGVGKSQASATFKAACDEFRMLGASTPVKVTPAAAKPASKPAASKPAPKKPAQTTAVPPATINILRRVLTTGHETGAEWMHLSQVMTGMKAIDPTFSPKTYGYKLFSGFIKAQSSVAVYDAQASGRVRLRTSA